MNFHINQLANNDKTIIENLTAKSKYHSQFRTGISNGMLGGGCRLLWKQQMFFNAYPAIDMDRPKYGELNIFNYLNEASPRFGGCFF